MNPFDNPMYPRLFITRLGKMLCASAALLGACPRRFFISPFVFLALDESGTPAIV
jgi:hypothetical protein